MQVQKVTIDVVDIPQTEPLAPYKSHLRTSSSTRSAIVSVTTDSGIVGWGEHNVNFQDNISGRRMQSLASDWLIGRDPQNIVAFHKECPMESRLKSGIELALWDICGQAAGMPVAMLLGGIVRTEIEVAACMGIQTYERAGEMASRYVEEGFRTLKTKAGASREEDIAMVRGVRDAVGDRLKLRIDPNCAYSPAETLSLCKELEEFDLEYLEQPIQAEPLSDAAWLRSETTVPLALNESVTTPDSLINIIRADAAEFILPDTHLAGGILPCVMIGQICQAASIPCIMHCGHDLGPKTAAMVHIAAACEAYSLANDTTYYGLESDIITEKIQINNGKIQLSTQPGLGITGDPDLLSRYRVDC